MEDISATGVSLQIVASVTFPNGFTFTEFADDADGFDNPAMDIASSAMNVNGDLVTWSAPTPLMPTINAIPGSEGDRNLQILLEANRAAKGKTVARDIVTIVATWPDGSTTTYSNGKMTNGMPGKSFTSAGRMKSKAYIFAFQDFSATAPRIS
jgi:hypothetical protein